MHKKMKRKVSLNRETLRLLEGRELEALKEAKGGLPPSNIMTNCEASCTMMCMYG